MASGTWGEAVCVHHSSVAESGLLGTRFPSDRRRCVLRQGVRQNWKPGARPTFRALPCHFQGCSPHPCPPVPFLTSRHNPSLLTGGPWNVPNKGYGAPDCSPAPLEQTQGSVQGPEGFPVSPHLWGHPACRLVVSRALANSWACWPPRLSVSQTLEVPAAGPRVHGQSPQDRARAATNQELPASPPSHFLLKAPAVGGLPGSP